MSLVLANLIILSVVTQGRPVAPEHEQREPHRNHAQDAKPPVSYPSPPVVVSQTNINHQMYKQNSESKTEQSDPPPHNWIDFVTVICAIVVAFFSGVTAKAIFNQIRTARMTDRAWILVADIGNPEGLYLPGKGYSPGIVYRLKVFGNTPARITKCGFRFHPVPKKAGIQPPVPNLPDIPDYRTQARIEELPKAGKMVAPGILFDLRSNLESVHLTLPEFEEIKRGDKIMCAYGFIEYKDAFGKNRKTQFCYVYDFAFGGVKTSPNGTVLNPEGFRPGGPDAYNCEK